MSSFSDSKSATCPATLLRIGQCQVDTALREIRAPGVQRPVRVTPKAMGVLLVLVEQAGNVVTRDALLAQVWPDTLPTNDVITQAVTQLRKAFGQRRGEPQYIETIAKSGYRLLARVEGPEPVATAAAPQAAAEIAVPALECQGAGDIPAAIAPPLPGGARFRPMGLLLAVLLSVALVAMAWIVSHGSVPAAAAGLAAPAKPYQLITSTTGFEISPALSPDGSQVAYVSVENKASRGARILVQTTDPSQPRPLTEPHEGVWDGAPVWSPNGREIAFLRRTPGTQCRVMAVSSSGGSARELAACDAGEMPSFDWSPDGASLIFSSSADGSGLPGMRRLDLASGQWKPVAYGATHRDLDHQPRYSPNGKWIAFIRDAPLGDVWRVPAKGGVAERLTREHDELRGLSWTPDGKAIVFGRRVDGQTRLFRLQLDNRQLQDLGLEDAQFPSIASAVPQMAFMQRNPRFGIYRLPLDAASVTQEQLFASSGRDTLPSVSPDGTQLLFTSDRSGDFGLWWAMLERKESLRLIEGLHPHSDYAPVWSQDGKRALVNGVDSAGRRGVFEVQPESGQVSRLDLPVDARALMSAAYVPDPDRLLVIAGRGENRRQLLLLEKLGKTWRTLAALEGVSVVKVDWSRQRLLFTRVGESGLWQSDLTLAPSSVELVDSRYPVRTRQRTWTVAENGQIEYMEHLSDCSVSFRHIGPGRSHPEARCLEPHLRAALNGFSASAHNRALYLSMATEDGANIAFMPLPELAGKP